MKNILLCCFALVLTACASISPEKTPATSPQMQEAAWEKHEKTLEDFTSWTLSGKAAINSGGEGGTVTVLWEQSGAKNYHLTFHGFLGHGRTEIIAEGSLVKLKTAEGSTLVSNDVQMLLGKYTGWYLPVEHLFYWVRGLPAHGSIKSLRLNANGYLAELKQADWTVSYSEYMFVQGLWLPRRLTLKHPGNTSYPPITVKWLSKDWNTP